MTTDSTEDGKISESIFDQIYFRITKGSASKHIRSLFCRESSLLNLLANVMDPDHFGQLNPDPHQIGKLDPDQHRSEKQDPDPHQIKKLDPDPYQSKKQNPDPQQKCGGLRGSFWSS